MPKPDKSRARQKALARAKTLAATINRLFAKNTDGRPPVLNREVIDIFVEMCHDGRPISWICDLVGIAQNTVSTWLNKGEAFITNDYKPKEHKIYFDFMVATRKACKIYLMGVQDAQGTYPAGEWQKFAWILERLEPKIFGKKDNGGAIDDTVQKDDRFV